MPWMPPSPPASLWPWCIPQAGNLGGGGFMLIRMADGTTHFIDFREKAPAAATANMYLDAQGNVIEDASLVGYKAIGVPGSVAGMVYAEKKYGKLTLPQVMAPAIKLARDGFALAWEDAEDLRDRGSGQVPRIAPHLSARRQVLQAGRDFSPARAWPAPWNASPPIPTISITAPWRANWPPPYKKAEA